MSNKPALYANTKSIDNSDEVEVFNDDNYDDVRDEMDWEKEQG